jgi:thiamine-phosphate pyrophosphorylase
LPPSPRPRRSLNPPRQRFLAPPPAGRLYAIVDCDVCARENRAPLDVARALLSGGARLLQLRCKSMPSGEFLDLAIAAVEAAAGATVIINDRADVAALSGATGLHVGQDDLAPADARRVIGDAAILGLSTHTQEQWERAVREPISYIAIGPVFGTGTKDTGYSAIGLETVRRAAASARGLPTVAIGGITMANARSVIEAGAASVAVISDLLKGDPEARVRGFLRALA